MTDVYRLPRLRIDAELHLVGRQLRRVKLFLAGCAEKHPGPERPSDLLNSAAAFIPAFEGDSLVIVNLRNVLRVTVGAGLELGADELTMLNSTQGQATQMGVEVLFDDGTTVRGNLNYMMPDGQRRIQDFLNSRERFFAIHDAGRAHLIHKSRVVLVTPRGYSD